MKKNIKFILGGIFLLTSCGPLAVVESFKGMDIKATEAKLPKTKSLPVLSKLDISKRKYTSLDIPLIKMKVIRERGLKFYLVKVHDNSIFFIKTIEKLPNGMEISQLKRLYFSKASIEEDNFTKHPIKGIINSLRPLDDNKVAITYTFYGNNFLLNKLDVLIKTNRKLNSYSVAKSAFPIRFLSYDPKKDRIFIFYKQSYKKHILLSSANRIKLKLAVISLNNFNRKEFTIDAPITAMADSALLTSLIPLEKDKYVFSLFGRTMILLKETKTGFEQIKAIKLPFSTLLYKLSDNNIIGIYIKKDNGKYYLGLLKFDKNLNIKGNFILTNIKPSISQEFVLLPHIKIIPIKNKILISFYFGKKLLLLDESKNKILWVWEGYDFVPSFVGDIDNNGEIEIINNNGVILDFETGRFIGKYQKLAGGTFCDLNRNGKLDLVKVDKSGKIEIYEFQKQFGTIYWWGD